jgi:hypothetical protein
MVKQWIPSEEMSATLDVWEQHIGAHLNGAATH